MALCYSSIVEGSEEGSHVAQDEGVCHEGSHVAQDEGVCHEGSHVAQQHSTGVDRIAASELHLNGVTLPPPVLALPCSSRGQLSWRLRRVGSRQRRLACRTPLCPPPSLPLALP